MSQSAPPGLYPLQPQTLAQNPAQGGPQGPQSVRVLAPTAETHYGAPSISDGTALPNNNGPLLLDGSNSGTLSNRVSVEFYNNGTQDVEVGTNQNFIFGKSQGRTIKPNTSWAVAIGPANVAPNVKHYALCGAGNTCSLEISEVGQ